MLCIWCNAQCHVVHFSILSFMYLPQLCYGKVNEGMNARYIQRICVAIQYLLSIKLYELNMTFCFIICTMNVGY